MKHHPVNSGNKGKRRPESKTQQDHHNAKAEKTRQQKALQKDQQKKPRNKTERAGPRRQLNPSTLMAPLPAVLVSCRGMHPEGKTKGLKPENNLITIAWAGIVCSDPPMLSIAIRPSRYSYQLIKSSGAFVVNLVDKPLLESTDFCGVQSGRDVDKFEACQLTAVPSAGLEDVPAVAESPLSLSCRLNQICKLGSHDLFIGEIVAVEAKETLFDNHDRLCLEKARLIGFAHGQYYEMGQIAGFFGFSVASDNVLKRRMTDIRQKNKRRPD